METLNPIFISNDRDSPKREVMPTIEYEHNTCFIMSGV